MNSNLDSLVFALEEKQDELEQLKLNVFTYNPRIAELTKEIEELNCKIKTEMKNMSEDND